MIFNKRKIPKIRFKFLMHNVEFEQCFTFRYLGVNFSYNGKFDDCKKYLVNQAQKAMYSVIKQSITLHLPVDIQLQLINKKRSVGS